MQLTMDLEDAKARAKRLRRERKDFVPFHSGCGLPVVETDSLGQPSGRGRREITHALTSLTLAHLPISAGTFSEIPNRSVELVLEKLRGEFEGNWSKRWALSRMKATIRNKKSNTLRLIKENQPKPASVRLSCWKKLNKMVMDANYKTVSEQMKTRRGLVRNVSHAGRGGLKRIRAFKATHGAEPNTNTLRSPVEEERATSEVEPNAETMGSPVDGGVSMSSDPAIELWIELAEKVDNLEEDINGASETQAQLNDRYLSSTLALGEVEEGDLCGITNELKWMKARRSRLRAEAKLLDEQISLMLLRALKPSALRSRTRG